MDLQLSPGIHFQSLALGSESSLHRAKLLWENTQETCGRDINKSISATPHWCQMLSSQQKQIIFRLLLIICPEVKSLCPSEREAWHTGRQQGDASPLLSSQVHDSL